MNQPAMLFITLVFISACADDMKSSMADVVDESMNGTYDTVVYTPDSIPIHTRMHRKADAKVMIFLFHQGRSNVRAEYQRFLTHIENETEFDYIAVDLRKGGQLYGGFNRTSAEMEIDSIEYCDVYADMVAALTFYLDKRNQTRPIVVVGSSYSAALAIKLAHEYPQINGVVAYSPSSGGPMAACTPNPLFESLKTPLLLCRPKSELAISSVKSQFELAQKYNHETFVSEYGVHGFSMTDPQRLQLYGNVDASTARRSANDATKRLLIFIQQVVDRE